MYSMIAFFITLIQLAAVGICYGLHAENAFATLAIYGSPYYLLMTVFTAFSALMDNNPIYLVLLFYHIVKYFIMFRGRVVDGGDWFFKGALGMEIAYLSISLYFVN